MGAALGPGTVGTVSETSPSHPAAVLWRRMSRCWPRASSGTGFTCSSLERPLSVKHGGWLRVPPRLPPCLPTQRGSPRGCTPAVTQRCRPGAQSPRVALPGGCDTDRGHVLSAHTARALCRSGAVQNRRRKVSPRRYKGLGRSVKKLGRDGTYRSAGAGTRFGSSNSASQPPHLVSRPAAAGPEQRERVLPEHPEPARGSPLLRPAVLSPCGYLMALRAGLDVPRHKPGAPPPASRLR